MIVTQSLVFLTTSLDIHYHPLYYEVMDAVTNTTDPPRKTKPKGRHPDKALSAAFVRTALPGRHCDGNGLYLFVQPSGARSWVQRLVIRGRRRDFGLGSVALVSLAEAREKARANRKLAREGGDPLAEKRRARGMPSFAEAAAKVVEQKRTGWRNPKQAHDWMSSLERYAFPRIGEMAVSDVTGADVLEILTPIWHVKAALARNVRWRIRAVLEWAVAMELRTDNPCDRLGSVLGSQHDVVQHLRALPHREVASAIEAARTSEAEPAVRLAFEFLVLTTARWSEVRWAEWAEIDRKEAVWTVPPARMKARREHRVPLCGRATEILEEARKLGDGSPLVFTLGDGQPIFDKRLRRLLRKLEIAAVPHGFRSSFRDWAAEETDHPREVVEAALAHVVRNKVEAAYRRTDLFERRRRLMDDWAAYLAERALTRRPKRPLIRRAQCRRTSSEARAGARRLGCDPLAVMSQPTLWGHASRVPGRGWRGAVPPLTPPTATAHPGRWTRRVGEDPRQRGGARRVARQGTLRRVDAVGSGAPVGWPG